MRTPGNERPTPAQVYGHPTLDDVPVSGPTDPGIWAADCWFTNNVVRQKSGCVDCHGGIVPAWAKTKGVGLSYGGQSAQGFGVGDPFTDLPANQQNWIRNALNDLNTKIVAENPGNACLTWSADISSMTWCFQNWYNTHYVDATHPMLPMDGVFDQRTLDGLKYIVSLNPGDFSSLPKDAPVASAAATPAVQDQPLVAPKNMHGGMSSGQKIGIAAAAVGVLSAFAYAATRPTKRTRK